MCSVFGELDTANRDHLLSVDSHRGIEASSISSRSAAQERKPTEVLLTPDAGSHTLEIALWTISSGLQIARSVDGPVMVRYLGSPQFGAHIFGAFLSVAAKSLNLFALQRAFLPRPMAWKLLVC